MTARAEFRRSGKTRHRERCDRMIYGTPAAPIIRKTPRIRGGFTC